MIKDLKSSNTGETIYPNIVSDNIPENSIDFTKLASALQNLINGKASQSDLETLSNALTQHTSNKNNPHEVSKSQVGLGNVDNTSDENKPISNATRLALEGKQDVIDSSHKISADNVDDSTTINKFVTNDDKQRWNSKQDALTFDDIPSPNSNNPIKSKGVFNNTTHKMITLTSSGNTGTITSSQQNEILNLLVTTLNFNNVQYYLYKRDNNGIYYYRTRLVASIVSGGYVLTADEIQVDIVNLTWALVTQSLFDTYDILQMNTLLSGKQDVIDSSHKLDADLVDDTTSTHKFVTTADKNVWNGKQDALVSGTNIKTINNQSLLGSGDITISGGFTPNKYLHRVCIECDNANSTDCEFYVVLECINNSSTPITNQTFASQFYNTDSWWNNNLCSQVADGENGYYDGGRVGIYDGDGDEINIIQLNGTLQTLTYYHNTTNPISEVSYKHWYVRTDIVIALQQTNA